MLLTDLSYQEWEILDAFEYVRHDLREVTFSMGKSGWAYVWPGDDVQEDDWDAEGFQARHLAEYTARCARIGPRLAAGAQTASEGPRMPRQSYAAAGLCTGILANGSFPTSGHGRLPLSSPQRPPCRSGERAGIPALW
ncbi:hypothetical protein OG476_00620 [Streptomyces sp. NBC_01396]